MPPDVGAFSSPPPLLLAAPSGLARLLLPFASVPGPRGGMRFCVMPEEKSRTPRSGDGEGEGRELERAVWLKEERKDAAAEVRSAAALGLAL